MAEHCWLAMRSLLAAVLTAMALASCSSGNHSKPRFNTREKAAEACLRDLEAHLASEMRKSSDSRFYDNWTLIKTNLEEYAIFDYGCKPIFAKGSSTGELLPYYFYLREEAEEEDGVIERQIVSDLKPSDSKENPYDFRYSYPLNQVVDFESLPPKSPTTPFNLPYSSIVPDAVSQGIAVGAVMRTCRNLHQQKINLQEAEDEIRDSRKYLEKANSDAPLGPLSTKGPKMSLKVFDARWDKCKSEKSLGVEKARPEKSRVELQPADQPSLLPLDHP
jgi:hypothetical protein